MTTIYQPPNMSDQSYNEFWGVTEGDCFMDTSGCIASDNFPEEYGYSHVCLIELTDLWEGASIDVIAFHTWDYLYVNDVGYMYWGSYIQELQGMVPVTTIVWSADYVSSNSGWKICREAAAPVEWANWTCTVLGDDCTRPFNNIYPNTSCSTFFSDPEDEDGDYLLHDGHPWCVAPNEHSCDERQPCGPCSCLAGEGQTYNSRVLRDNWTSYSYIVCTPCLPGRSSPSVATALPISAPPAAAASIPAPTEPRPATRAKEVALRRRKEVLCARRAERDTTAQMRVLQSVRSVPLGSTAWQMPALARRVILVTPQQQAQIRVRRALQVASVAQSVQIRACLVSRVVTVPMPAARGARTATSAASQMSRACPCATFAMMF